MRLVFGLAGGALAVAACSTFAAAPDGSDGGGGGRVDAEAEADASDASVEAARDAGAVVIATGELHASEIVVDESLVMWTIDVETEGVIRSAVLDGGAATTVAGPCDHPRSLHLSTDLFYYATGHQARFGTRDGGADASTQPGIPADADDIVSILEVGQQLAFLRGNELDSCMTSGSFGCGNAQPMSRQDNVPGASLTADPAGNYLWFTNPNGVVSVMATNINSQHAFWAKRQVGAFAIDPKVLYFVTADPAVYSNPVANTNANDASVVTTTTHSPYAIAIDDVNLYFTLYEDSLVMKVPKNGSSAAVPIASVPAPEAIAVNSTRVFVVLGNGTIMSFLKGD